MSSTITAGITGFALASSMFYFGKPIVRRWSSAEIRGRILKLKAHVSLMHLTWMLWMAAFLPVGVFFLDKTSETFKTVKYASVQSQEIYAVLKLTFVLGIFCLAQIHACADIIENISGKLEALTQKVDRMMEDMKKVQGAPEPVHKVDAAFVVV